MKRKILLSLSAIALSVTFLLLGAEFTTQAAGNTANHVCTDFNHSYEYCYDNLNPSCHWVTVISHNVCTKCGEDYSDVVNSYAEGHDYILDYSTNVLTCSGCGDSYDYTK